MNHFPNLQNNSTKGKGVIKNFSNEESSYANSVLQSLSSLDFALNFKNDIENKNIKNDPNFLLSYDLYKLISNIISGNDYNSLDIIEHFKNKYYDYKNNIKNENVLEKEPFYFLYYLLQFIHFENNIFKDPNYNIDIFYNQPLENQKNDTTMLKVFNDFMDNTQNSIISKNFYIFMKYTYNCPYCGTYYKYLFRNILKINLDGAKVFAEQNFPDKKGTNLSLDDGLNYYFSTIKTNCKNEKCQNNVDQKTQIFSTKNILIIIFEKNNKMINYDLSFERTIDLAKYRAGNIFNNSLNEINNNFKFELKSCICYDQNSKKYLSICLDNNNGICYKYVDNKCEKINNYMCDLEPKILLYEKCTGFVPKNNFSQNNSINWNNQFNNNNQANNFNQFNINNNQSYNNFNQGNNNNQFYPNNNMNMCCNINNNCNNMNQFNLNNNFNNMNQFNFNNNCNNMNQFNFNNNCNNMNQFNLNNNFNNMNQFNNNNISNSINNNNNQINRNDNFKYFGNNQFNQNNYNNKALGNQNFLNKSIDINQSFANPLKNINKESIDEFNKMLNLKGKNTVNSQKVYNNYNNRYYNDSL